MTRGGDGLAERVHDSHDSLSLPRCEVRDRAETSCVSTLSLMRSITWTETHVGTKFDLVLSEQQHLSEQQILCKLALRFVLDGQQILQTGLPSLSPVGHRSALYQRSSRGRISAVSTPGCASALSRMYQPWPWQGEVVFDHVQGLQKRIHTRDMVFMTSSDMDSPILSRRPSL